MPTRVKATEIVRDPRLQMRVSISADTVETYAELYQSSPVAMPPVDVVVYNGQRLLVDGWHRLEAFLRAHPEGSIQANELSGSFDDAVILAAGANSRHGLQRSNADKRRAVEAVLSLESWRDKSTAEIAKVAGVSERTVKHYRSLMSPSRSVEDVVAEIEEEVVEFAFDDLPKIAQPEVFAPDEPEEDGEQLEWVLKALHDHFRSIKVAAGRAVEAARKAREHGMTEEWISSMEKDARSMEQAAAKCRDTLRSHLDI